VFAVNLLPAFGPPTWSLLVFFSLDFDLPAAPLGSTAPKPRCAARGRAPLAFLLGGIRPRRSGSPPERR
jgi:hypothetical protein